MINYIFENYVEPIGEFFIDATYKIANCLLTAFVVSLVLLALPLWIVPYAIGKYKSERK